MATSRDERLSSRREEEKLAFLSAAGMTGARREPMAGDASTRSYERLHMPDGQSLILMNQPPSAESQPCPPDATPAEREALGYNAMARLAAGRIEAFVGAAHWLRECGLSAPEILYADPALGFAVLEDLGDDLYAPLIRAGANEGQLYDAAIDVLRALHAEPAPKSLKSMSGDWPLLDYDAVALKAAADVFVDWLPELDPRVSFDEDARAEWEAIWTPIYERGAAGASVFCHRDYHAENLIWLPERLGEGRVGLLDFQDAVRAHPVWDLSMLLHDARRDISRSLESAALDRYLQGVGAEKREVLLADYHVLGALNIIRILGVFSRLVARDSKPRYRTFMPRMWVYLDRVLTHPDLDDLAAFLSRHVPAEVRR